MKPLAYLAAIMITASALVPSVAGASWVMHPEDQHATLARCPRGFQLISVTAGDADLLVCSPRSRHSRPPEPEQAKLPSGSEGPLEGPKFN